MSSQIQNEPDKISLLQLKTDSRTVAIGIVLYKLVPNLNAPLLFD